jgi:hypothetical protein
MKVEWSCEWSNMLAKKIGRGVSPSFTFSQWQRMMEFAKELLAESPVLKYSIIAAGVGGLFEIGHTIWLAVRYLAKF